MSHAHGNSDFKRPSLAQPSLLVKFLNPAFSPSLLYVLVYVSVRFWSCAVMANRFFGYGWKMMLGVQGNNGSCSAGHDVHQRVGRFHKDDRLLPHQGAPRTYGQDGANQGVRASKKGRERREERCHEQETSEVLYAHISTLSHLPTSIHWMRGHQKECGVGEKAGAGAREKGGPPGVYPATRCFQPRLWRREFIRFDVPSVFSCVWMGVLFFFCTRVKTVGTCLILLLSASSGPNMR